MTLSDFFFKLYRVDNNNLRKCIFKIIYRLEGGELYSLTMRRIFKEYYNVEIGLYTHGGCFIPFQVDKFTKIGNYCSFATSIRISNRNHPMHYKSMHGFFFNPNLKYCSEDNIEYIPLTIWNDVWIGYNAIIMPNVTNIGTGAVIGAGAVVNKDIPPYAVVVGNPARIVRFRFSKDVIKELLASKWWEKSIEEIYPNIQEFCKPFESPQKDESKSIL